MRRLLCPVTIRDDRGTARPLVNVGAVDRWLGLRIKNRRRRVSAAEAASLITLTLGLPGLFAVLFTATSLPPNPILLSAILLPLATAGIFLHARIVRRALAADARTFALAMKLCASCGYTLRDIPASGDGRTQCPECGAAWNLAGAHEAYLALEFPKGDYGTFPLDRQISRGPSSPTR